MVNRLWVVAGIFGAVVGAGSFNFSGVVAIGVGIVVMFVYSLYSQQEKILYQPHIHPEYKTPSQNPDMYKSPAEHNLPFEDVTLVTPDQVSIKGWHILQPQPRSRPTLLFLHANAGNMGFRLPNLAMLYKELQINIFILSYRGYGESEGTPSEHGLIIDAKTALEYLLKCDKLVDPKNLFVFGRSLGGGVAIALASEHYNVIRGLILENTFTTVSDVVDHVLPYIAPFKRFLLKLKWHSVERIPHIACPILFISGLKDEVVPASHMTTLYRSAKRAPRKSIFKYPQGMHNDTWMSPGYIEPFKAFLSKPTDDITHVLEDLDQKQQ